jgi:ABC-type lipoprotein export system ATPase subunit
MDDPFGDLDESGELAVVDLANHLASEVKHVIVTAPRHVAGVKATQITRVEKKGGVSRLS